MRRLFTKKSQKSLSYIRFKEGNHCRFKEGNHSCPPQKKAVPEPDAEIEMQEKPFRVSRSLLNVGSKLGNAFPENATQTE